MVESSQPRPIALVHRELLDAALRLFVTGGRELFSLQTAGWVACADPGAAVGYFADADEMLSAAGLTGSDAVIDRVAAGVRALGKRTLGGSSKSIIKILAGAYQSLSQSERGRMWLQMMAKLAAGAEAQTLHHELRIMEILAPVARREFPGASDTRISFALQAASQTLIGALAWSGRPNRSTLQRWETVCAFLAGGIDGILAAPEI